jgi:hypothetical protein
MSAQPESGATDSSQKKATGPKKAAGAKKKAAGSCNPAGPSQATKLVQLALARYRLGVSPERKPFAYHPAAPHVALPLKGSQLGLRAHLAREYFTKYGAAPSQSALADCCSVLEGTARDQTTRTLHLRVTGNGERIHIDMADRRNQLIEISGGAWKIIDSSPYMFTRTELTGSMPEPVAAGDGDIAPLWAHINVTEADRPVLLAVMIDALIQPGTAKPVTCLQAEHGSAKTTTAKCMVQLVDPLTVPVRGAPRNEENWLSTAAGSWVVALDNLSTIQDWLSDALCRASTGDGNVKRALYTDDNLSVTKFRRAVILTGIDMGGLAADLTDRLVSVELAPIVKRRSETELETMWQNDWPIILSGLLDLAAKVHHRLSTLGEIDLPRMADFGRVLACVDDIGETAGMARYYERAAAAMADSAISDSFIARLIDMHWPTPDDGMTAADILRMATPGDEQRWSRPVDWPKKPRTVSVRLAKHAPALRLMGWQVSNDGGRNILNTVRWKLVPPNMTPREGR